MTLTPSKYLLTTSREYAIYICRNRAIPFVGDGLKHGQMIALWVLRNRAEKLRTFALSGLMAYERLYVHGEVSASDTIGFMAAPYKNNVPLIEGLGHFGSRLHPDDIGAPRYTDVKRAKAAEMLLYKDLDIIPLEDNYDGSNKQPCHFLPLIPLVLLNGISGIAIGWSTNILPRDLKALVEATKAALLNKPIKPIPPTYAKYDISVNHRYGNSWEFCGKAKALDGTTVHITELPPGMDIEKFRKHLNTMEDNGQIHSYVDRSTESVDINIKMKRRVAMGNEKPDVAITDWSEDDLIEYFKLRERVKERIVVIDWSGQGMLTYENAEDLIKDFAQWRLGWYTKRFEHYRTRDQYELRYLLAIKLLFDEHFPKRLGTFTNRAALQDDVAATLAKHDVILDDTQADRVVSLPTYRWTKDFDSEVSEKIIEMRVTLAEYDAILASPERLRDVYLGELDEIKVK